MRRPDGVFSDSIQISSAEFRRLILEGKVKLNSNVSYKYGTRLKFINDSNLNESVVGTVEGYLAGENEGEVDIRFYKEKSVLNEFYGDIRKGVSHFVLSDIDKDLEFIRTSYSHTMTNFNRVMLPNESIVFFNSKGDKLVKIIENTIVNLSHLGENEVTVEFRD